MWKYICSDTNILWSGRFKRPKKPRKRFIFLEKVVEKLGCLPVRNIMNNKEFFEMFAHIDTLIIDVTEQRITRPSNEGSP